MNEGPYRGHCLTEEPKVSFAKEMQIITLEAQKNQAEILKRNTEVQYNIIREQIRILAKRGVSKTTLSELFNTYAQSGVKGCRQTLVTLLGRDGFNVKRIETKMKNPINYEVSWYCL